MPASDEGQTIEAVSSNIDDKTLHELYLWPFQDVLHAGSGNIMCSYQRLNNSYSCANSKLLNGILKTELGFQGFVVSDWGAQHAGVATALAGLDMAMPNSPLWSPNLTYAVQNGSVPMSRIDDMATRIIATWYQMNQDKDYPSRGIGIASALQVPHKVVNAKDPSSKQTLLDGAVEGHVLVKNIRNALPLKSPQLLSLFGYSGKSTDINDISLAWTLGFSSSDSSSVIGIITGGVSAAPDIAPYGTLISGAGSGSNSPAYISSPFDAIQQRAYQDNTALFWDFNNTDATGAVDPLSDACLVFINAFATEGVDRKVLNDTFSDTLVANIAKQCNNTIVVIHNAGIRLVDAFIANPNVTAVIYAHLPGQDSGRALVSILYGDVSPSGKLPYTVAKSASDYGTLLSPSLPEGKYAFFPQSDFSEGGYIDYRAFEKAGIEPRFEFGFGLSYTSFSYSNLQISKLAGVSTDLYPVGPIQQGGQTDLWDVIVQVTADITNSGKVPGQEVAQLYVGIPGGPIKQLRGFSKVGIEVGKVVNVHFDLLRRDLSVWDVAAQKWKFQKGDYKIYVGSSSRTLPLTGTLTV
jgi:beta-glucosidase